MAPRSATGRRAAAAPEQPHGVQRAELLIRRRYRLCQGLYGCSKKRCFICHYLPRVCHFCQVIKTCHALLRRPAPALIIAWSVVVELLRLIEIAGFVKFAVFADDNF